MEKLIAIILILIQITASGSTRYIATNGNDNNDGSFETPFATFDKAVSVAAPGDIFLVKDGTYVASNVYYFVLISCSGTAHNYITFQSLNKYGAIIRALTTAQDTTDIGFGGWNSSSYIKIKDFVITKFDLDGIDLNQTDYPNHHWIIEGCKIYEIGNFITDRDNGIDAVFIGRFCHHITVTKCWIFNIGRIGPENYYMNKDHAIYTASPLTTNVGETPYNNVFTYNLIYKTSGCPITMSSEGDTIANNIFAWPNTNGEGGNMFIWSDGPRCINNAIINNIFYGCVSPSAWAIQAYSGTTGWSVKNNMVTDGPLFYGAGSAGWQTAMDGGNYGSDCENPEVDPLFVHAVLADWQAANFSLQSTSPAINKGIDIGLITDYAGNPIQGLPDIGAYEFQPIEPPDPGTFVPKSLVKNGKVISKNGLIISKKISEIIP